MSITFKTVWIFLVLCNEIIASPRIDPLVETKVGLIRGLSANDGDYSMFLGIPFGVINETNSFGPSTPYPEFEETFEAYYDSGTCPQMEFGNIFGSLDCLHLNIFVPKSASSQNFVPVLVWIHGGGFSGGFSGTYGPKFLVRHDIIVVTINYRLGPYGFMCPGIPEVPGNQGLKDQLLALWWINDNIHSFGGDVSKITIMGESAGAMSIDLHLNSAQPKLFRSAILESGVAFLPGLVRDPRPELLLQFADKLGFVTEDVIQSFTFLSSMDPHLVIAAASSMDFGSFFPCVEKQFDNIERFLPDYPDNTDVPNVRNMPVLIGFNDKEMLGQYANQDSNYFETLGDLFADYLKNGFDFDDDKLNEMETAVRRFYLGDEQISQDVKLAIIDMASDFCFNHPIQRTIAKYLENGANNIYHYVFSYNGRRNLASGSSIEGAAHADELGYLFDLPQWQEEPVSEDQLIIDRMTTMWANFVKYSNPTPQITELLPVGWDPIVKTSPYYYMNIDSELKLEKRPFHDRMAFWDLFYNFNKIYVGGDMTNLQYC